MDDLLEDIRTWSKSNKDELPEDAKWCGKSQNGIFNSHYGKKHSEETKQKMREIALKREELKRQTVGK